MKSGNWHNRPELKTLCLIIVLLLHSCSNREDYHNSPYGENLNDERRKIGLCQLRENWTGEYQYEKTRLHWRAESVDSTWIKQNAYYGLKTIFFTDGVLAREVDVFISPQAFEVIDGTMDISLMYVYNFIDHEYFSKGWRYYFQAEPLKENISGYISKNQADSILHSWGLEYPS